MTQISAAEVNKLRKMTGAGMMDCKAALIESEGDFEKAIDYLRKKGQKVAAKRADRDANEGIVISRTTDDKTYGVVVMVNCETDFVAKNDEFKAFANEVVETALLHRCKNTDELLAANLNGRSVQDNMTDLTGKTGERTGLEMESIEAAVVAAYNHQGNRLATLLGLSKDGHGELAHELAMQVAAMSPIAVDKDDVPENVKERELEIGREQARQEGKPENMLDKIAEGKLNRFYKDSTLMNQDFIRDSKLTVGQYVTQHDKDLKIIGFRRLMLGE
jgi:elongation factor Ts